MKQVTVWLAGNEPDGWADPAWFVFDTRAQANSFFNEIKEAWGLDSNTILLDKVTIEGAAWRSVASTCMDLGADLNANGGVSSQTKDGTFTRRTVRHRDPIRSSYEVEEDSVMATVEPDWEPATKEA